MTRLNELSGIDEVSPLHFSMNVDPTTLRPLEDTACLSDYDDGTNDAKCVWNFENEDGLAAELIYRLPECSFDSRFYFHGAIAVGNKEQSAFLISMLPGQDVALVAHWTKAFQEGGLDQAWISDQIDRDLLDSSADAPSP